MTSTSEYEQQAQYFLANIYASGNGVAADADKARAWLKQSGKHGYAAALNELHPSVLETADDHNIYHQT